MQIRNHFPFQGASDKHDMAWISFTTGNESIEQSYPAFIPHGNRIRHAID